MQYLLSKEELDNLVDTKTLKYRDEALDWAEIGTAMSTLICKKRRHYGK